MTINLQSLWKKGDYFFIFIDNPRFKNDKLNTWPNLPKIKTDKDELLEKLRLS